MNTRFTKGEPLTASDLNELADAACQNIFGGPGCAVTRLGKKVVISERTGQKIPKARNRAASVWKVDAATKAIVWEYDYGQPFSGKRTSICVGTDCVFVGGPKTNTNNGGSGDYVNVVKLSAAGEFQWEFSAGVNEVYAIGTDGTAVYLLFPRSNTWTGSGGAYANLIKLDTDGNVDWVKDLKFFTIAANVFDLKCYNDGSDIHVWVSYAINNLLTLREYDDAGNPVSTDTTTLETAGPYNAAHLFHNGVDADVAHDIGRYGTVPFTSDITAKIKRGSATIEYNTAFVYSRTPWMANQFDGYNPRETFAYYDGVYILRTTSTSGTRYIARYDAAGSATITDISSEQVWEFAPGTGIDPKIFMPTPTADQFFLAQTRNNSYPGASGTYANLLLMDFDGNIVETYDIDSSGVIYTMTADADYIWAFGQRVTP